MLDRRSVSFLLLTASLSALWASCCADGSGGPTPPEAQVDAGKLRGKWTKSESGRNVAAFEGVPYAQPPVGELRFKSPQPVQPWSGVKAAEQPGLPCIQRQAFLDYSKPLWGSEDCLTLNVYAPEGALRADGKLLPVMLYVHGGGFEFGSGAWYGPELLTDHDVVFVNFNYRLGALGFFSTGDEVVPGNNGLKDAVLVLNWVRNNIRAFGGDPSQLTLFGESAGSVMVNYLMLSPRSKGLFQRAVAMSGSALAPWAFVDAAQARRDVPALAGALGCPATPAAALRECLLAAKAEDIQALDKATKQWGVHPFFRFRPTEEPLGGPDAFLDRHPICAYVDGKGVSDVPLVTGLMKDEGCVAAVGILENAELTKDLNERFDEVAPILFQTSYLSPEVTRDVLRSLRKSYLGDKPIGKETQKEVSNFLSDALFTVPALETVALQVNRSRSPVYLYEVARNSDRSWATFLGARDSSYGACHADDLLYVFPLRMLFPEATPAEKVFSKKVVDLLITFAQTGNPTRDGSWAPVQHPERAEYAVLSAPDTLTMQCGPASDRLRAWAQLPVNVGLAGQTRSAETASCPAGWARTAAPNVFCQ